MTRRALLTGVTGYIGGRLALRLIADGWTVDAIVRESSETSALPGAIRTHVHDGTAARLNAAIIQAEPDVVFHLASLYLADHGTEQVETLIASNILLPIQLAQAMVEMGVSRLVNTGTASQHSRSFGYHPASLYAATKQACGDLLLYFHEALDLSVVTLKIYDTYGAGDPRRKIVQLLVDAAMSGGCLDMSPGDQVIDLTHVDDVVEAFVVAADRLLAAPTPLFEDHLLSGERHSVRELVPLVEAAIGRPVDARFGARPYRTREVMVPVEATADRQLPGWHPRRRLHEELPSLRA